jgi:ABC-type polysaccharide/polyol phosphate export permease
MADETIFREVLKYRDLLYMLVLRDIRIRYKQAAMGFLWAIFMPITAVLSGVLIQKAIAMVSGGSMDTVGILSISVKVLPWTFFISSIRFAVQSLVGNMNLITKIYFPREVLPLSATLASLFDFAIAAAALAIMLVFVHIGASVYLLLVPVLLVFLVLFTAGMGLLLASANLFFRDVKYVVEIILMFGIFFTPVFYNASTFGKWQFLLMLNPVGSILESLNAAVVHHALPNPVWLGYAGVSSLVLFVVGAKVFHMTEPLFAENI